jgi:2,3-dihydroxybenzoate decarboxylase
MVPGAMFAVTKETQMLNEHKVVAIEEHFSTANFRDRFTGYHTLGRPSWRERLDDLGALRIREMDEAGIDIQVISQVMPGPQIFDAETSVALARESNDILYEAICAHPDRFAGFAALPTPDPKVAADELERTVTKYGFKGGYINGLTNGKFHDEKQFWVIFERAQALNVPIYLHPATPHPTVIDLYLKEYPAMVGAGWGFTFETATQAIRLIMSGVFDVYPRLKFVLGHLGESLPFSLKRCDEVLSRDGMLKKRFRDYFCENFYITTSGNFSVPALLCSIMEMGVERIIFAVDWPMRTNTDAMNFIRNAPISEVDKDKILRRNVRQIMDV